MSETTGDEMRGAGVNLVLGGGGARGIAHLGVIDVLEREGIPIGSVSANSAGGIVGALWQQQGSAAAAIDALHEFISSRRFRRLKLSFDVGDGNGNAPNFLSRMLTGLNRQLAMHLLFRRQSIFHRRRLEGVIHGLIRAGTFEDLDVPMAVVCVDLVTGGEVVIDSGDLRSALVAASAVPGFFPPIERDGRTLIDSGQANNLPVQVAAERFGRPVVAVNLGQEVHRQQEYATGIEIMFRSDEIGTRWNSALRARDADLVLGPQLDGQYWLDFSRPDRVVEAGREVARAALPEVERLLATHEV